MRMDRRNSVAREQLWFFPCACPHKKAAIRLYSPATHNAYGRHALQVKLPLVEHPHHISTRMRIPIPKGSSRSHDQPHNDADMEDPTPADRQLRSSHSKHLR